jgi:hypothetical protein
VPSTPQKFSECGVWSPGQLSARAEAVILRRYCYPFARWESNTAPQAAETPIVAIGIGLRASRWQIQFRNNLSHNGFVFQDASVKEKRILFRLRVIGYAASREVIIF